MTIAIFESFSERLTILMTQGAIERAKLRIDQKSTQVLHKF